MEPTTVYPARLVRTMDPSCPEADAVAIRGGRFRAVGSVEELISYPNATLDRRFHDKVLLPGFVEAHSHAGSGSVWADTYVGFMARIDPDGRRWAGCGSIRELVSRLQEVDAQISDPESPLLAWGFDPIYYPGESLTASELDEVSTRRPIHIAHTSGHACAVNTATLRACGIDSDTDIEGVIRDRAGQPTGELHEFAAMRLVGSLVDGGGMMSLDSDSLALFGQNAVNTGTTTLTDLGSLLLMADEGVDVYRRAIGESFPARLNVFHLAAGEGPPPAPFPEAATRLTELRELSTDKLRFGNVKLMLDGTLQGFTARVQEPGYFTNDRNGIWNLTAEEFYDAFETFHRSGSLIHVHCNGDQATELFLDTLESVLIAHPRPDHRHTCTHSQMSSAAQYRRMAALGACANIFSNHIWAWGDQHLDITVGPDRARRNNAAATALRHSVPISIHSDTPVTPLGPLATVKHAVTRRTVSGRIMGENERIGIQDGLEAITLGAAYMLKMDHEVGSITPGKYADMAVLSDDPLTVDPLSLEDIHVSGTVVSGQFHPTRVPQYATPGHNRDG